jgi:hypothetical protein
VGLSAWFGYRWLGLTAAVALAGFRAFLELYVRNSEATWTVALINCLIRIVVLVALAILLGEVGRSVRALVRQVALLEGILPICSYCKRIRDDQQTWQPLESYISARSAAHFSHGICPTCFREHFPELADSSVP